jgi:hypothetical protein
MGKRKKDSARTSVKAIECPPRKRLAGVFIVIAAICLIGAFKVLFDLIAEEALDAAIMGFVGLVALAVGFTFAARACTGLKVDDTGVSVVPVVGTSRTFAWKSLTALVYCLPRSPDAAEAFWFEAEGGARCGIPLTCAHAVAREALDKGIQLKIIRYYQLAANDFLEGKAYNDAEKFLKKRLKETSS